MKPIFFLGLVFFGVFLFLISVAAAVACEEVGSVDYITKQYCSVDGNLENLKLNGASCLNPFECANQSCIDGKCQSKYGSLGTQGTLEDIWDFIIGVECTPGEDDCATDHKLIRTCGNNSVWEDKNAYVNGRCGYIVESPPLCPGPDCPCSGCCTGNCGSSINIKIFSPANVTYDKTNIPLQVADLNKNAKFWRYSLNNGAKVDFTPNTTITASVGGNKLDVFARKYQTTSSETKASLSFSVVLSTTTPVCGDNICNGVETSSSCPNDCQPSSICGDGYCALDESSFSCPDDCNPNKPKSYLWLFILLIILLILAIIFVLYLLIRRIYGNKNRKDFGKPRFTPQIPPRPQFYPSRPIFPTQPFVRNTLQQPIEQKPIEKPAPKPVVPTPAPVIKYVDRPVTREVFVDRPVVRVVDRPVTRFLEKKVYVEKPRKKLNIPTYDYLGSSETKIYHKHLCRLGKLIKRKYKLSSNSESFFKKRGFKKCKGCFKK